MTRYRTNYYNRTTTLAGGVADQEVDIGAVLGTGHPRGDTVLGHARYLKIVSDVAISFKINSAAADSIACASGSAGVEIPADAELHIKKVYLTHSGVCGAGAASVIIRAI